MVEEWRELVEKPGYFVSNLGRYKRHTGTFIKGTLSIGYIRLNKFKVGQNVFLHRLVAAAFLGPCPEGMQVNHKNGVKSDNRIENLEYVTASANIKHTYDVLKRVRYKKPQCGTSNGFAKFNDAKVREMRELASQGMRHAEIARRFNTAQTVVSRIIERKSWKHVD